MPQKNAKAEILSTHNAALFNAAVKRASDLLRAGEVVALPTETVYGLAANALDPAAVARIYEIKGRPAHNPIIVHVADLGMARRCAAYWPAVADAFARAFWPGPLTLVLPRSTDIPDIVAAGGPTVGVRWPSHPFIQAVIRECGFPLAAPSANLSNQVSPTNAAHVAKSLGDKIPLIVDGGQSQVGIESTVLELTANSARVLRPGIIQGATLRAVFADCGVRGGRWVADAPDGARGATRPTHDAREAMLASIESIEPLRSPGQLPRHYSPKAKLQLLSWRDTEDLRSKMTGQKLKMETAHVIAHTVIPSGDDFGRVSVIPHDAEAFARALYAELHACDELGAECIIVERLPDGEEWAAIADRLKRAAG